MINYENTVKVCLGLVLAATCINALELLELNNEPIDENNGKMVPYTGSNPFEDPDLVIEGSSTPGNPFVGDDVALAPQFEGAFNQQTDDSFELVRPCLESFQSLIQQHVNPPESIIEVRDKLYEVKPVAQRVEEIIFSNSEHPDLLISNSKEMILDCENYLAVVNQLIQATQCFHYSSEEDYVIARTALDKIEDGSQLGNLNTLRQLHDIKTICLNTYLYTPPPPPESFRA